MKKKTWEQMDKDWMQRVAVAFGVPLPIEVLREMTTIPQLSLANLHEFGRVLDRATKTLERAAAQYAWHAAPVIAALREGIEPAHGQFAAALDKDERRSIKWRKEFERVTSRMAAAALLAAVTPKITYSVVVTKTKAAACGHRTGSSRCTVCDPVVTKRSRRRAARAA